MNTIAIFTAKAKKWSKDQLIKKANILNEDDSLMSAEEIGVVVELLVKRGLEVPSNLEKYKSAESTPTEPKVTEAEETVAPPKKTAAKKGSKKSVITEESEELPPAPEEPAEPIITDVKEVKKLLSATTKANLKAASLTIAKFADLIVAEQMTASQVQDDQYMSDKIAIYTEEESSEEEQTTDTEHSKTEDTLELTAEEQKSKNTFIAWIGDDKNQKKYDSFVNSLKKTIKDVSTRTHFLEKLEDLFDKEENADTEVFATNMILLQREELSKFSKMKDESKTPTKFDEAGKLVQVEVETNDGVVLMTKSEYVKHCISALNIRSHSEIRKLVATNFKTTLYYSEFDRCRKAVDKPSKK